MTLPPFPPWEGFHVLLVHFPVALLLVAPLLMVMALLVHKRLPGMGAAAWLVLLMGTVSAWVAVLTGRAAFMNTGEMPDVARAVMKQHGEMGRVVRNMFTGLCAAYLIVLLVPVMFKHVKAGAWRVTGTLLVLAAYGWAAIYLVNTAHFGGRLVHEFGIRAAMGASETTSVEAPPTTAPAK